MANENIKSLYDADARIKELETEATKLRNQINELSHRCTEFVDNPRHYINKEVQITPQTVMYIPTMDKNRHFAIKVGDMDKHFDKFHYPTYFLNEQSCCIFDSIFPYLNDLIKFKTAFDASGNMNPSKANPVYHIIFDVAANKFFSRVCDVIYSPVDVYFSTKEIADQCCIWMNYKYGLGEYSKGGV